MYAPEALIVMHLQRMEENEVQILEGAPSDRSRSGLAVSGWSTSRYKCARRR